MDLEKLKNTAQAMVAPGKGILAMDESSPTEPTTNEIRITIRNLQGEEKELIIRYNE